MLKLAKMSRENMVGWPWSKRIQGGAQAWSTLWFLVWSLQNESWERNWKGIDLTGEIWETYESIMRKTEVTRHLTIEGSTVSISEFIYPGLFLAI